MLEWLGTKKGLRAIIVILAIALILSIVSQVADWSGIGGNLTGASGQPSRDDPLMTLTYGLEIEGQGVGFFASASGIGSESEVAEHKVTTGSGAQIVQKIPGRTKWTPITLERGLTSSLYVWDWRQMVVDGNVREARANCSIIAYDQQNNEIARWELENAWPSAVSAPASGDESTEYAVEGITIVHEGMERVK
jgi:phage tail-like protein